MWKIILTLTIIFGYSLVVFAQPKDDKKEEPVTSVGNVSEKGDSKNKIEIISPKKNERVIKNTKIEIAWKYVSDEKVGTEKEDGKEKISIVKIELTDDGTTIKDIIETKHNNKTTYDWYVDKEPQKYTLKITDKDNGDINCEIEFNVVDAIDIFLPNSEDTIKGGSEIIVGWTINYDRMVDTGKVKLEFSVDGGNTWKLIDTKGKIGVNGQSYLFRMNAPDDIANKICKFRVTDETNSSDKRREVSDVFHGKRSSNSNYILRLGGDFDFFEGVKVSDLHTTASIYLPEITRFIGVNLYLGRSRGHGQDTLSIKGPFSDSTLKSISSSKKSDIVNIAMGAGLTLCTRQWDPFYCMPLYFEYRRGLREVTSVNETVKTNGTNDTTIINEVTDKKTIDEWLVGLAPIGFNFKHKLFEFTGYCVLAYNTASQRSDPNRGSFWERSDVILRFDLLETGADISFGGELRYPLVYSSGTPAELTFYLTKDISLSSLYNDLFGRSSK